MAETAKQKDSVYDDDSQKPITRPDLKPLKDAEEGASVSREVLRNAEEKSGFYSPSDEGEGSSDSKSDSADDLKKEEASPSNSSGGFYNDRGSNRRSLSSRIKNRKKWLIGAAIVSGIVTALMGLFISFGRFNLSSFMANIEQRGFARYQVDLNGRSCNWLETYMMVRFGEIEDPRLAPKDRDNILFR
jgi:hypothetical protein